MYQRCCFNSSEAHDLAAFLNDLRQNHWTLTSSAYEREPERVPLVTAEELIEEDRQPERIGTFLLKRDGRIISSLRIDDKYGDGRVAILSNVETHPEFQRRGVFGRLLGEWCLRKICDMDFERIEITTWTFNRKGIPLYKRAGFRAGPGTSLFMENYIPLILKHPSTRPYFAQQDFIRTFQNQKSYGYDTVDLDGLSVFQYHWKSKGEELKVLIDWQRRQIASIQRPDWTVWCFVAGEHPFRIHYQVENRMPHDLPFTIRIDQMQNGESGMQALPGGLVAAGDIEIQDPPEVIVSGLLIDLEIGKEQVPFPIRRFREITEKRPNSEERRR